jgi:hypothetical protein
VYCRGIRRLEPWSRECIESLVSPRCGCAREKWRFNAQGCRLNSRRRIRCTQTVKCMPQSRTCERVSPRHLMLWEQLVSDPVLLDRVTERISQRIEERLRCVVHCKTTQGHGFGLSYTRGKKFS